MIDKDQNELFNECFTRLRENEKVASNLCIRIDNLTEKLETSTSVTDKFLEAFDRRRIADEAREAKFWKAIVILVGALIALALGKEPTKALADHILGNVSPTSSVQACIPPHNDERHFFFFCS